MIRALQQKIYLTTSKSPMQTNSVPDKNTADEAVGTLAKSIKYLSYSRLEYIIYAFSDLEKQLT